MAEVIGLIAASTQLLAQTTKIISLVRTLRLELRDEFGTPARNLSHAYLLQNLAQRIKNDCPPLLEPLVQSCLEDLNIILNKLEDINAGSRQGWRNRFCTTIKFKAKEKEIVSAWKNIEAKISALSLALGWENCSVVGGISKRLVSNVEEFHGTRMANDTGSPTKSPLSTTFEQVQNTERNKGRCSFGRDELLAKISSILGGHGTQNRVALYGLAGIGKSSLAHQYATNVHREFPETLVFCIQADTRLHIRQDYLKIASRLKLTSTEDSPISIQHVMDSLHENHLGKWIMIVDNVGNDAILHGEEPLMDKIPTNAKGSVIFTTRSRTVAAKLAPAGNIIMVDNLGFNAARDLFCHKAGLTYSELCEADQASIAELVRLFNYLPLAICHAGAFISGQQLAISEYVEIFNTSEEARALLLDDESFPQGPARVPPVLLTFSKHIDYLSTDDPPAEDLLSFIACLGPKNIPKVLLVNLIGLNGGATAFLKASGLLRAHCLITSDSSTQKFDIDPVVRLATRRWLISRNRFDQPIAKALVAVLEYFPKDPSSERHDDKLVCGMYLPHAHAVLQHRSYSPEFDRLRCSLANRCSRYLQVNGSYGHAEWFSTLSVHLSATAFGLDHPDHFTKQEEHANVLRGNGEFAAAMLLHRDVLVNRERILGEHKDTFSSLNNLDLTMQDIGQYAEAENLHRRALEGRQKMLGEENPDTLASLHNLSLVLEKQVRDREAENYARRAVYLKKKIHGREHLSTLLSVSALAICLQKQGKLSEAEDLHREVLRGRERELGEAHPLTLNARLSLIGTLAGEGQFARIENIAREHFALIAKVRGPQHFQSLLMGHNLAFILFKLGKNEDAEKFARETFLARKETLGMEHPDTKATEELLDHILDAIKDDITVAEERTRVLFDISLPETWNWREEESARKLTTMPPEKTRQDSISKLNQSLFLASVSVTS